MLRFVPIPKIDPHGLNWTIQHWVRDRYLNFESSLHHTLLLITGNPQAETRVITSFVLHPEGALHEFHRLRPIYGTYTFSQVRLPVMLSWQVKG